MKYKWRVKLALAIFILCVSTAGAAIAIPGPHRMMAPSAFGFKKIDHNIYAPPAMPLDHQKRAIADIQKAEKTASAFFGFKVHRPTIVLCPDKDCDRTFGKKRGRGIAYGKRVIRLNQKGINQVIATHELMHTSLKASVGEWRTYFGAVPAWFDEGLAVLISQNNRYEDQLAQNMRQDLLTKPNWWQWGDLIKQHGWRDVYGGAKILVSELENEIGRDGLRELISEVSDGKEFHTALEELSKQKYR